MNSFEKLAKLAKNLTVLYIEDDTNLREKTTQMFENIFLQVDTAINGFEGIKSYKDYFHENDTYYDIVITDIKMPMMNGVELAKEIKTFNSKQLIVVTSAYENSEYLIEFININVNKFLKKPFTLPTVVNTFLELLETNENTDKIVIDKDFYWDNEKKKLFSKGEDLKLSYSETIIFDILINNANQIFSNSDLSSFLTYEEKEDSTDNMIKSAIKRLRKKLPEDMIKNIYGQGYQISL